MLYHTMLFQSADLQTIQHICFKKHPIKWKNCFKDQDWNKNHAYSLDEDQVWSLQLMTFCSLLIGYCADTILRIINIQSNNIHNWCASKAIYLLLLK